MNKPHIEINDMSHTKSSEEHCYLISKGWKHVGDNGQYDLYSNKNGFDMNGLILPDAFKLQKMIDAWENEK